MEITKDWLCQKYVDEKLSTYEVAVLAGVTSTTIRNKMRACGIPVRAASDRSRICSKRYGRWSGKDNPSKSRSPGFLVGIRNRNVTGNKNPMFGRVHSEETREKIRQKAIGRKMSNETKTKISRASIGKPRPWRQGANNQNWKGGVTAANAKIRAAFQKSPEYKAWKKAVLERDGGACVKCDAIVNVQAHHIRSFIDYPELRLDVANGETLCVPCHRKTDSFGFRSKVKDS